MRKVKRGYYEVEFVDVCANPSELPQGKLTEMHTDCWNLLYKKSRSFGCGRIKDGNIRRSFEFKI